MKKTENTQYSSTSSIAPETNNQRSKWHLKQKFVCLFKRLLFLIIAYGATLGFGGRLMAASAAGDVGGKVTVGYQGWFACTGDGSPINAWWHWSQSWSQPPSPGNNAIKAWPDVRENTTTFQTGFANLN